MSVKSYRDLTVWRQGIELVDQIYRLTRTFPKSELYGMTSQMQRAAVSVPSNIAEGHQRDSTKEFLHHIAISLGSLAELDTLVQVSEQLGYLNRADKNALVQRIDALGKMLRGLQKSLKAKVRNRQKPANGRSSLSSAPLVPSP